MTFNMSTVSLFNMIGNVGKVRHEQDGTRREGITAPPFTGGTTVAARRRAGRGRAARVRHAHHRFAVERSARGWRHGGSQEPATGSTLWARRCAAARVDEGADRRGSSGRLCHGSVDLAARGGADRTALYTFVQRDTSMAHLRVTGIFLPATLGRSAGARRQCDQALEANSSADAKKTLRNKDESSSSSTNRD